MKKKEVVTCFLESEGKILILKRSKKVGTYQERWAGVSGYLENSPKRQAMIEIKEETGIAPEDVELIREGDTLEVEDIEQGIKWKIYPFLFGIKDKEMIEIDWEHTEIKWIDPARISKYQTVPKLEEALKRVWTNRRK